MPRRRTAWIDTKLNFAIPIAGEDIKSLLSTTIPTETRGYTLTRMIGRIDVCVADATAAFAIQSATMGIAVVSQEAFLAGVVPDPQTDTEFPVDPWVWKTRLITKSWNNGTSIRDGELATIEFDIRSQRKIHQSELVLITQNESMRGTATEIEVNGLIRSLFLLP